MDHPAVLAHVRVWLLSGNAIAHVANRAETAGKMVAVYQWNYCGWLAESVVGSWQGPLWKQSLPHAHKPGSQPDDPLQGDNAIEHFEHCGLARR